MNRPKLEVADVLRRYGEAYREQHAASLSTAQRRVMSAIELCRTAALGAHLERCDRCPYERTCYDSCRNRHCPKCRSLARAQWIEDRQSELLDECGAPHSYPRGHRIEPETRCRRRHPSHPSIGALFASKIPLKEAGFSQRQPDQFRMNFASRAWESIFMA
jgi:hypothetical protein